MSKMEAPTAAPPSASTSPKLVQFPENNEDKKLPRPVTSTRSSFPHNLLNCVRLFTSKPREKKQSYQPQRVPERKILKTPTLSTLSLSKMDSSIEAKPYKWPHDNSFDPKTTALVIIDMQKDCECFPFKSQMCIPLSLSTITCTNPESKSPRSLPAFPIPTRISN